MRLESRHSVSVCSQVSSSTNMPHVLSQMHAIHIGKYLQLLTEARIFRVTGVLQLLPCKRTPFIYQLNAHSKLGHTLNETLQRISVAVYHIRGENNVSSSKPNVTAKLYRFLVCNSFVIDVDDM